MPVLEIALLHILPAASEVPSSVEDGPLTPYIKQALEHALRVLQASTPERYPFRLLQQHEDPSYLYIVGFWPSVETHEAFIPSEENKALLTSLEGKVEVEWMCHVRIATSVSEDAVVGDAITIFDEAPVVAIGRHGVEESNKELFEPTWKAGSGGLSSFSGRAPVGGWREGKVYGVKKDEVEKAKEEWVLLTGWDAVEQHGAFAASDAFKEYSSIRQYVASFEVRHARKIASSE